MLMRVVVRRVSVRRVNITPVYWCLFCSLGPLYPTLNILNNKNKRHYFTECIDIGGWNTSDTRSSVVTGILVASRSFLFDSLRLLRWCVFYTFECGVSVMSKSRSGPKPFTDALGQRRWRQLAEKLHNAFNTP